MSISMSTCATSRPIDAIVDAFQTLLLSKNSDVVRAVGPAPRGGEFVEIVVEKGPLRDGDVDLFAQHPAPVARSISGITAALVYFALHYMFVRPMNRITQQHHRNSDAIPKTQSRVMAPSGRDDEIGTAERELSEMEHDLADMLHQKSRLAALGLAVSKINHDLRNLLSSAQLFSDRLAALPDPKVQQFAPKLLRSLERAIALCQSTLVVWRGARIAAGPQAGSVRRPDRGSAGNPRWPARSPASAGSSPSNAG